MIRFDHIAPEELGRIRAVSLSDRFIAARDLQSQSRNGVILAGIAIPTLRIITCDFRVSGRNRMEIIDQLDRLARWLQEPGEAMLEVRNAPGRYYKAFCSELSEPAFSGLSAACRATFTCTDYRQYNLYNHQPVEGADPETENFTFAGKHCLNDMDCLFVLDQRSAFCVPEPNTYPIPGMAGTLRYDAQTLPEGELSGKLYFVGRDRNGKPMPLSSSEAQLRRLADWLGNAGRADLIFDALPTKAFEVEVTKASFSRDGWENGCIQVTFAVQPLLRGKEKTLTVELTLKANQPADLDLSFLFPEGMTAETPLRIEMKNMGNTVERLVLKMEGGEETVLSGMTFSGGSTLLLDAEDSTCQLDGIGAGRYLTAGSLPYADPGQCLLKITADTGTTLQIEIRARARFR